MVQQDYQQLLFEHRQVKPYREQAGELALQAFRGFNEPTTLQFLAYFGEVCKGKNSTYQYMRNAYKAIQEGTKGLTASQMRYFLFSILPFLPAEVRMQVLLFEVLDSVQKQRLTITRYFSRKADIDTAFNMFSQYLAGIYNLEKYPYSWFYEKSYNLAERTDIINAVEYVYVVKLKASVSHFKKDLQIIAEKAEKLPKKMTYFIELLGVEVNIPNTNFSLERLYTYDEIPMPVFTSKFDEALRVYLFEQLSNEDYLLAVREMQEAVLAHDLETALLHYRQSQTLTNKVDISFLLKGGAGMVKLEIKSWLNTLLTSQSSIFHEDTAWKPPQRSPVGKDVTRGTQSFFMYLVAFVVWGFMMIFLRNINREDLAMVFTGFLGFAVVIIKALLEDDKLRPEMHEQEKKDVLVIASNFKTFKRKQAEQSFAQYQNLIQEKQAERAYWGKEGNTFDKILYRFQQIVIARVGEYDLLYPDYMQDLYDMGISKIHTLQTQDLAEFLMPEEEKEICLDVMKYLLQQKIRKAYHHFKRLVGYVVENEWEGFYHCTFLNKECAITPDFYAYEGDMPVNHWANFRKKENFMFFQIDEYPRLAMVVFDSLANWLRVEIDILKDNNINKELQKLKERTTLIEQTRVTHYLVLPPFLHEGEEGVLFL